MLLCCALSEAELIDKNQEIEFLINKLALGNMNAMDKLYELIKTDVYAFALSKCQNAADAEDILQDTFIQIYKYANRYVPQKKPLAWIFTIVTNLANRKFQINSRNVSINEYEEIEIADSREYESQVIDNEFINQIMKVLKSDEQQIIVLHIVSGLKHREIAQLLGMSLSTVLSKYNRAIKKLQKEMEEDCNE